MKSLALPQFGGLATSLANPSLGTAKIMSNVDIHRIRGAIQWEQGYAKKFSSLPSNDTVIKKISGITIENVANFYVPDHGGRNITALIGKYTKTAFFSGSPMQSRMGVWVRPYWKPNLINNLQDRSFDAWHDSTTPATLNWVGTGTGFTASLSAINLGRTGKYSLELFCPSIGDGTTKYISLPSAQLAVANATAYTLTFWVKGEVGEGVSYSIGGASGSVTLTADWQKVTLEFTSASTQGLRIWNTTTLIGGTAIFYVDDVALGTWVDDWDEITEFYMFTWLGADPDVNGAKLFIDDGSYNFGTTIDASKTVFNNEHFIGWTVAYENVADTENYDIVQDCGYDTYYYLQLQNGRKQNATNKDFPTRVPNCKLYVYRNFTYNDSVPATLVSQVSKLLNDLRITSGNSTLGYSSMVGYRNSEIESALNGFPGRKIDEIIYDTAVLNHWQYAALLSHNGDNSGSLIAGTYYFKYSIVMDDGSETDQMDALTGLTTLATGNSIAVVASKQINLATYWSPGALPKRASKLRIYASNDGTNYYFIYDKLLTKYPAIDSSGVVTINAAIKHWYQYNTHIFDGTDWTNKGALLDATSGRLATADSNPKYSYRSMIGRRSYICGVLPSGATTGIKNQIFMSAANGDGVMCYDIFPNDAAFMLDLEYNDGDQIVAIESFTDRIVAFKQRSIVILTQSGDSYLRDLATQTIGLCSVRSIAKYDDVIYFADVSGIYSISTRGLQLINPSWQNDWRTLTAAQQSASFGTFDRLQKQYRLTVNGKEYVYDVDSGDWVIDNLTNVPTIYAIDVTGTVDFLSTNLYTLGGTAVRHDSTDFTGFWESNRIELLKENDLLSMDIAVKGFSVLYECDQAVTLSLYLNDSATALASWTLAAANKSQSVFVPLSMNARCKAFRFRLSGLTNSATPSLKIKGISALYDILPSFGDGLVGTT